MQPRNMPARRSFSQPLFAAAAFTGAIAVLAALGTVLFRIEEGDDDLVGVDGQHPQGESADPHALLGRAFDDHHPGILPEPTLPPNEDTRMVPRSQ